MKIILYTITALAVMSCNSAKTIFEEHRSVGEDMTWQTDEPITFEVDVKENKHSYELAVAVRYSDGFPFDKLPIHMIETSPQGESVRKDIDIMIQPSKGEYLGEKGLDIIDLEQVVDTKKEFPTFGKYTYTLIPSESNHDAYPLILEIGLVLKDPLSH
jgi:gliding motility-associated lipoprotein GldH